MQKHLSFRPHNAAPFVQRLSQSAAAIALATAVMFGPAPAVAQGLFAPAVTVNDAVVTNYELEQRARFLTLLRDPGDPQKKAREDLILDRLKLDVLAQAGIEPTEEEIVEGMTELAGRANLSLQEFLNVLGQNGVAPETLRDFTRVGIAWREYIAARYLAQARPSEEEIDRAMGLSGSGGVEVLLSELIMPINAQNAAQVEDIAQQVSRITTTGAFSQAAQQYSATATRQSGGRLPWMPLTNLPPQLQQVVLGLRPGEVTAPLPLDGAVALFQLRDLRETSGAAPSYAAIEYAAYYLPGGRTPEALAAGTKVINAIDTCDDLYGVAKDQDPSVLDRETLAPAEIPQDIAIELAKLDPNETSLALTRNNGQTLMLLMLCGRTAEVNADASRESVGNALTQQRLGAFADSLLEQLKADARISDE
ncbi:peptidylprolyl isomerase [Phaeobacter gallaeciensis]|uniref:Parvulin-like PPIase n=1 Tax=Phaeobacter gallaeciensis TaxID=60890 RepID=A0AAC9Z761_9RHOB|nr:peptidylprolyl isomerase [Phaeobacter gallaeciensis]AHD09208.1 periplasmic chaperone for outer membrane protein SurA [Phaeobacter gallaeciensis DSM 26640]ATE92471.1 putative chaperone surA [Phaeobacter gallaeciensis]ATE97707.1 putative chaperone surA [Phaeobacter gallaeciensis]ATF01136.1 putative chaperone surA [Phaeobacter gallaeciensis]ATF05516.1 putative chaperone surA [Phaeobacter gallaeciensis]